KLPIPDEVVADYIEEDRICYVPIATRIAVRRSSFPNELRLKLILAENLVEHLFDVVAGVPVAVVIKAAGLLEHSMQLDAAGAHVLDVGLGRFVPVFE